MSPEKQVKVMVCTDPRFLAACPAECLEKVLNLLPAKLSEPARKCQWAELSLRIDDSLISGVAILNSCPTRANASYLELYRGYFVPFIIRPDLQAVFRGNDLVSCRYGMQRQQLIGKCQLKNIEHRVNPREAVRIYRKLRRIKILPSNVPLVLLYMSDVSEIYVFVPGGRGVKVA